MAIKFDKILGDVRERDDATFVFTQAMAATTWTIAHNLNKRPSVTVVDNLDRVIDVEVIYIDNNNLTTNTNSAISGKAYLN